MEDNHTQDSENPLDPSDSLRLNGLEDEQAHPQTDFLPGDSATTRAEKIERKRGSSDLNNLDGALDAPTEKRVKLDEEAVLGAAEPSVTEPVERQRGVAPIKKEYLVEVSRTAQPTAHVESVKDYRPQHDVPAPSTCTQQQSQQQNARESAQGLKDQQTKKKADQSFYVDNDYCK